MVECVLSQLKPSAFGIGPPLVGKEKKQSIFLPICLSFQLKKTILSNIKI